MYILVNRDSGVRLSEANGEYKQFWKQICLFGEYVNPNGGAHPNCSCVEKFGMKEDSEEIFDYSKLSRTHPDYMDENEQKFYEIWRDELKLERIPKEKSQPTSDFLVGDDKIPFELKTISKVKSHTIRNRIFRATDKGKRNVILQIDNESDIKRALEQAETFIKKKEFNEKLDRLIITFDNTKIDIK